jgi:ABC-type glycerol-3-phosphate transport system substrate-binding protein
MALWLPPEFDPGDGSPAGELLRARLDQFEGQNNIQIEVRLKEAVGTSGLLESLSAASAAAPLAMPAVVALSRPDLESAALKGLLTPLDGLSNAIDDPDWYAYARELALVQGVTFGLPFAGDGLVLAYRPAKLSPTFATWDETLTLNEPLAFSAGSPLSLVTVSLYRSVGGEVEDAQRRPTLQPDALTQVFELYRDGAVLGLFPVWLTQFETDTQVWQAYQAGQVNACLTWTTYFMAADLPDSLITPLPRLDTRPSTLATGWAWAVADPLPERRQLSARLVEWLSEAGFLAEWTEAAGVLPTRPEAVNGWQDQSLKAILGQVAESAHARPSIDLLNSLGPGLSEATLRVIRLETEPSQAAAQAAERLANPESR